MHHPFHISNDEDSKRIIVLSQHVVNKHIQNHSVMQKAASMASVLVLIFTNWYGYRLYNQHNCANFWSVHERHHSCR